MGGDLLSDPTRHPSALSNDRKMDSAGLPPPDAQATVWAVSHQSAPEGQHLHPEPSSLSILLSFPPRQKLSYAEPGLGHTYLGLCVMSSVFWLGHEIAWASRKRSASSPLQGH